MKNILIIGALGFIGKNLIEELQSKNVNLVLLTRNLTNAQQKVRNMNNVAILKCDLQDIENIKSIITNYEIDTVIHLASGLIPSSDFSDFNQELKEVIEPTYKLIHLLASKNIKFVYFSSGGTIYGNTDSERVCETNALNPINYYGYSKLLIENFIRFVARNSDLNYLILRPSNVYGRYQPKDRNQGFIAVAINKLSTSSPLTLYGKGEIIRDYINVIDLINITVQLLDKGTSREVINIGSGTGMSLNQIIEIIENITKNKLIILSEEKRLVDTKKIVLNIDKLNGYVNYTPKSLKQGIEELLYCKQI
ncbi:NAD-dependent epimerase/dehydratase family protein [Pseudoalteromonas sp. SR41-1]|uniref:NAD-dependent epimerase/dehydratase family protein n=1 Tax=Pseudoalteromonas sp. SR41-1 TaxID=2760952 RepID=UPI001604947B|nr:NAD-dependent epimerase/dehydratase family protein [Pseudoalteromonas sp. SR41-1]MBB1279866.1 NAD-dependent epimerase/dehydratase family protein [Pseudoalteromonas sp. SR41-1]